MEIHLKFFDFNLLFNFVRDDHSLLLIIFRKVYQK